MESILRRCDHSGDQFISYSEFSEMTAFVENLSYEHQVSPSSLDKHNHSQFSPIAGTHSPGLGGSADRYERANTFGGSPMRAAEEGDQANRDAGFNLRTTQMEKQPSVESQRDQEATPVLGGGSRRVANGPSSSNQQ
jgi:hypothetical protein